MDTEVLRWIGYKGPPPRYMERIDGARMTKKTGVNSRGARGRTKYGWMDGVKRASRDRGLTVDEAIEHTKNRK